MKHVFKISRTYRSNILQSIKNQIKCRLALCSAFNFTPLRTRFTVLLSSIIASPDNPLLLALLNHDNVRHCRLVIY